MTASGQRTAASGEPRRGQVVQHHWTQRELAEKPAVAEQQVQRYEVTQYRGVSVERLQAVADELRLRVREVITFEPL